ncbi:MAG: hypothetical protein V4678_02005 [Patescibacteria group bacterium]
MSILTSERHSKHRAESTGEILVRRQVELAKAAFPHTINEAADAPFVDVEDTLSRLTSEAEEMIQERGKPSRRVRRSLSQYAHRLLEITDVEPDLLDPHSISLIAHAADATGERNLLQTTLEQAHRADLTSDTNVNLQAIEAALELDLPFTDVMRTLNKSVIPYSTEEKTNHIPLSSEYDHLFVHDAHHIRTVPLLDQDGHELSTERPLFRQ